MGVFDTLVNRRCTTVVAKLEWVLLEAQMRIVHEVYGKAQVGGSVDAYVNDEGDATGGRCDLLAVVPIDVGDGGVVAEEEAIFIEGDVDDVIDMLQSMLSVLIESAGPNFAFKRWHSALHGLHMCEMEGAHE